MSNKEIATHRWKHFTKKRWCPCGVGSTVLATKEIRGFIERVVHDYDIKTISDAPCGQFDLWTRLVDFQGAQYVGYDITDELIEHNRNRYPNISFCEFDIVKQVLPKTDLIICRDCLFHLPDAFMIKALENFKKSGSSYLMSSTYNWVKQNKELNKAELKQEYGYRPINLLLPPYSMEPYIDSVFEPRCKDRTVGLWRLN